MSELLIEVEYRQDELRQGPGRIVGTVMPYGVVSPSHREAFDPGSLRWPDDGVLLRTMHRRDSPVMRVLPYTEDNEVRIDAVLPDTQAGRDTATNMRPPNRIFSGLSVEFNSLKETRRGGIRVLQDAMMSGLGLVDFPSYKTALAEIEDAGRGKAPEVLVAVTLSAVQLAQHLRIVVDDDPLEAPLAGLVGLLLGASYCHVSWNTCRTPRRPIMTTFTMRPSLE